jgi:hypothetical protein
MEQLKETEIKDENTKEEISSLIFDFINFENVFRLFLNDELVDRFYFSDTRSNLVVEFNRDEIISELLKDIRKDTTFIKRNNNIRYYRTNKNIYKKNQKFYTISLINTHLDELSNIDIFNIDLINSIYANTKISSGKIENLSNYEKKMLIAIIELKIQEDGGEKRFNRTFMLLINEILEVLYRI